MKKLQDKTKLRQTIKNSFDTTRTLDRLHIYTDGKWDFLSVNSDITHEPQYCFGEIFAAREYNPLRTVDECITEFFKQVESDLSEKKK